MRKRERDKITKEHLADGERQLRVRMRAPFKGKPHIGQMLATAYFIIDESLRRMAKQVDDGEALDREQMRAFTSMADVLQKLAKEERAQDAGTDPEGLTDEELLAAADEAKKLLGGE